MKTTVVVLVVLGLVAAMSAVLLVNILPGMFRPDNTNELKILVAAHAIPVHTQLKNEDLVEATIDLAEEGGTYANPNLYLTDPINVVGKTVSADVSAGQPITKDIIITDLTRAEFYRRLQKGMRAYPVRLTDDQIVGGLLEPGCFVDVLVATTTSVRSRDGHAKGEAVSKTFLERIEVIAVKGELAGSGQNEEGTAPRGSRGAGWTVTLLVDTAQAEALQLATSRGDISLTLRNPTDEDPVNSMGTVWDSSKIGILGGFFDDTVDTDTNAETGSGSTSSVEVRRGREKTYEEVPNAEQNAG